MTRGGFIETFPPIMICLATKAAFHCLDDVTRVSMHSHSTWFFQSFQAEGRRGNFSLLIRRFAEISSERAPQTLKPEQRHRRRARSIATVAQTRAVTKDRDQFRRLTIRIVFAHEPPT